MGELIAQYKLYSCCGLVDTINSKHTYICLDAPTVEEITFARAIASDDDVVTLIEWLHYRLVLVTFEALYNNLEIFINKLKGGI